MILIPFGVKRATSFSGTISLMPICTKQALMRFSLCLVAFGNLYVCASPQAGGACLMQLANYFSCRFCFTVC